MKNTRYGLAQFVAGLGIVVFAVVLVGLTKSNGSVDWVSVVTAVAGAVLALMGVYTGLRGGGPGRVSH